MNNDRRDFIKGLALISAGMVFYPSCSVFAGNADSVEKLKIPGVKNFGLQLYTLRDKMPTDPKGVLKSVAAYGYKEIESYEGPQGIYWGMTNKEFKKYMDGLGMKIVSAHCDINKDFEKKAAEAAEIGIKYLICPWLGPQKTMDDYKRNAELFNEKGEICRKNGIRFAYHNHDYSFKKMEGKYPQEVMMEIADKDLVDFELDMYWVIAAGEDIEAWLKKYKNRFRLCHIKDFSKNPGSDNGKNSVDLGTGSIDWKKILKTAHDNGMKHYIVEQEAYPGGSPLESVKANAKFMQSLAKS